MEKGIVSDSISFSNIRVLFLTYIIISIIQLYTNLQYPLIWGTERLYGGECVCQLENKAPPSKNKICEQATKSGSRWANSLLCRWPKSYLVRRVLTFALCILRLFVTLSLQHLAKWRRQRMDTKISIINHENYRLKGSRTRSIHTPSNNAPFSCCIWKSSLKACYISGRSNE